MMLTAAFSSASNGVATTDVVDRKGQRVSVVDREGDADSFRFRCFLERVLLCVSLWRPIPLTHDPALNFHTRVRHQSALPVELTQMRYGAGNRAASAWYNTPY